MSPPLSPNFSLSLSYLTPLLFLHFKPHTYELRESNVRLRLTVVDTVGYGDQINKEDCWKPIVDYIDAQFEGKKFDA